MFTFTLAFLQAIDIFQPLSSFHGKRKNEFGRKHSQWKSLTTTTSTWLSGVSVKSISLPALQHTFHLFPKENAFKFQSLEENLWTINQKTEFADLSFHSFIYMVLLKTLSAKLEILNLTKRIEFYYYTEILVYLLYASTCRF